MSKASTLKKKDKTAWWIHLFFILFCAVCILPMFLVLAGSFSTEKDLAYNGFSLWPRTWDTSAYEFLFANPQQIVNAYKVTIFTTLVGTLLSLIVMIMMSYALSRPHFKYKKLFTAFIFFPTLFSGGMVPSYIINTQYLHLTDSLLALILPSLVNVFHVIMLRTFFKQLPSSLFEAAKIDGAGEFRILWQIAVPLSTPAIATVGFLGALTRWNEWYNCMLYIRSDEKMTLQYLLQRMMENIDAIKQAMSLVPMNISAAELPSENLRMAMVIVAIGPMLLFFPFFQKYFTRGMTVGAVKE